MRFHRWITFAFIAASPALLHADLVTIDFEAFPDGTPIADSTPITTQFPGLTFTNTMVITAGISLNELNFPPNSGSNVTFDNGGPIGIAFDSPVVGFSGHFTYSEPLTIDAFNSSGTEVASATSDFSNNLACGGGPPCLGDPSSAPNELIQLNFAGGFSSITITGDPNGFSFAMDDISTTATATPEPTYLYLMVSLIGGMVCGRFIKQRRRVGLGLANKP